MTDRVWRLNSHVLPDEWGAPYGLKEVPANREPYGVSELIDGRYSELAARLDEVRGDHEAEALVDHARKFRRNDGPARSIVAVVTAPYLRSVVTQYGSAAKANARIHQIASQLGLYVRVGHPADTIYLSNRDDDPTLTTVWWQPARFELPFPQITDPNPAYVHRMENPRLR